MAMRCECMDWCYGQIVDKVKSLGLEKNTLIVFSSDNGPLAAESPSVPVLKKVFGQYGDPRPSEVHLLRGYKGTIALGRRSARAGHL